MTKEEVVENEETTDDVQTEESDDLRSLIETAVEETEQPDDSPDEQSAAPSEDSAGEADTGSREAGAAEGAQRLQKLVQSLQSTGTHLSERNGEG